MHPSPLVDVDVQHLDGSVTVVLRGELDLTGVAVVRDEVRPLLSRYDAGQVTLDCRSLTFIDGAGLTTLEGLARAAAGEGRIALTGCSELLRRLLPLCGLDELFDVQDGASQP